MAKTIGLAQLAQKKYVLVEGLPEDLKNSIGEIEDAFDAVIWGHSNNGKSSFIAALLVALIKALKCKCEYVAYEEAHGKTIQDTMIKRYNMLEEIGNSLLITDHYTYEELDKRMGRKQSAKIWVIDSIQVARFTAEQVAELKRKYVTSRKRKILIMISWSEGKEPQGAAAKAVKYLANIKMRVENLIMFPLSRYGGGEAYVIHRETAIRRWGEKEFYKAIRQPAPPKPKKKKTAHPEPATETEITNLKDEHHATVD